MKILLDRTKGPFGKGLRPKGGGGFLRQDQMHFGKGKPSVIRFADATSLCEGRLLS